MAIAPATITYIAGADLPDVELWWRDNRGDLIDFSSGWTFTVEIGCLWDDATVDKTMGITGAAGSGDPCDGTPNVTIAWAAGELDPLSPGRWTVTITATRTSDGRSRKARLKLIVEPE